MYIDNLIAYNGQRGVYLNNEKMSSSLTKVIASLRYIRKTSRDRQRSATTF